MDQTDRALIIDRAAASEPLAEPEFGEWAQEQRVFVSSVMDELRDERRAVAIASMLSELTRCSSSASVGARTTPSRRTCMRWGTSSIYLGILGRRYGRLLPSRFSAMHTEYLEAERLGLRVAIWAKDLDDREGHEASFLEEVRAFHTTGNFRTADELADDVDRRLRRIAAEDLAPWVKLGPVVFRARTINDGRERIAVEARVRDRDVLAALEALAPDQWGRGEEVPLTYAGRVRPARIEELGLTTTAGSGSDVRLALVPGGKHHDSMSEISVSEDGRTYSPADLTELGMRHELFGEPLPRGGLLAPMADMGGLLRPLEGLRLSEEIVRPIVHLLLTEDLVGRGRAARVIQLRLGLPIAGRRKLELEWETPRRYTNVSPERRSIDGVVDLGW